MLPSKYDRTDDTKPCPECRAWMPPLTEYEICTDSEAPEFKADTVEYGFLGLWAYPFNYVYDLFTRKGRQNKLAAAKEQILPHYPNSLVCNRCLHIEKRP